MNASPFIPRSRDKDVQRICRLLQRGSTTKYSPPIRIADGDLISSVLVLAFSARQILEQQCDPEATNLLEELKVALQGVHTRETRLFCPLHVGPAGHPDVESQLSTTWGVKDFIVSEQRCFIPLACRDLQEILRNDPQKAITTYGPKALDVSHSPQSCRHEKRFAEQIEAMRSATTREEEDAITLTFRESQEDRDHQGLLRANPNELSWPPACSHDTDIDCIAQVQDSVLMEGLSMMELKIWDNPKHELSSADIYYILRACRRNPVQDARACITALHRYAASCHSPQEFSCAAVQATIPEMAVALLELLRIVRAGLAEVRENRPWLARLEAITVNEDLQYCLDHALTKYQKASPYAALPSVRKGLIKTMAHAYGVSARLVGECEQLSAPDRPSQCCQTLARYILRMARGERLPEPAFNMMKRTKLLGDVCHTVRIWWWVEAHAEAFRDHGEETHAKPILDHGEETDAKQSPNYDDKLDAMERACQNIARKQPSDWQGWKVVANVPHHFRTDVNITASTSDVKSVQAHFLKSSSCHAELC